MSNITREIKPDTITVPQGGQTVSVELDRWAWGSFQLPAAITSSEVTVNYSNDNENWTAAPALAHETNPITVAAGGTYSLPSLTFTARYMQLAFDQAEAAARDILLFLRS